MLLYYTANTETRAPSRFCITRRTQRLGLHHASVLHGEHKSLYGAITLLYYTANTETRAPSRLCITRRTQRLGLHHASVLHGEYCLTRAPSRFCIARRILSNKGSIRPPYYTANTVTLGLHQDVLHGKHCETRYPSGCITRQTL